MVSGLWLKGASPMNMRFKVGIVRNIPGKGWKFEYGIFKLDADSMLADMPYQYINDPSIVDMFGVREDQPEYDEVHDFNSLTAALANQEKDED